LRIISGHARGRKLFTPGNSKQIRPTSDRAREALFSIIGDQVYLAHVLDLYAGTGALGIEALSRGAKTAVFVDKHKTAIDLIEKNCSLCLQGLEGSLHDKAIIIKYDISRGLTSHLENSSFKGPFDLIFLDPPYEKGLAEQTIKALDESSLLHSSTQIIAEDFSGEVLPDVFTRLHLTDKRKYGETGFWFYSVNPS
jgi:16S rRNA (guanine966-N2)-methyltransferase